MEQITSNIDILKTIFNYLKLNEQIIATQVCPEFQYTVVDCMWRYKYRQIKVYKLNGDAFVINLTQQKDEGTLNFLKESFVELVHKELKIFWKLNAQNITELELCDYRSDDFIDGEQFCDQNDWTFSNLQKLVLQLVKLDVKELEMIFKNCKKIKTLYLKQCHNSNFDIISLSEQDNCDYDALMKILKQLKEFHLEYRDPQLSNSTINFHDLLVNNNLTHLNINIPLASLRYKETPRLRLNSCQILRIGYFTDYKLLQKFARLYLNSFQNLLTLALEGSLNKILIETQFIKSLSLSCLALKNLSFKRCLMNVDDFGLLSSITEISLDCCMSLTWRNLRQLLELPLLQCFHTHNSTFTREIENIFIPFSLTSLTMVGNEFRFAQIFLNPEEPLLNLKQLIYYDGSENTIVGVSQKFPNLETLHILPHHLHKDDLFRLKYLRTFKTHKCRKSGETYLELLPLIKHSSLRELSITGGANDFSTTQLSIDLSAVKCTNLCCLSLDFALFNYMLEFFFDLLHNNSKLKLCVIADEIASFQYYYELVNNRKFCRNFIMLCGFQIDCKDFFVHPKSIQRKLDLLQELSDFRNIYFVI